MKLKEVRRRMLSSSAFKLKRKVSMYNAKIGRIMATESEGRELGERLLMKDVKRMVRDDPSMLDGFTTEEEAEMVAKLEEKCKTKFRGTRANNPAAVADAKCTVERMMVKITGLLHPCIRILGSPDSLPVPVHRNHPGRFRTASDERVFTQ
ncbi:hypothetical protein DFH09DRAFT_1329609 [Mycena vulgaris]|nr:hypothetical protein DFH09DRAFT_1329609 [Mycena vulgaris]